MTAPVPRPRASDDTPKPRKGLPFAQVANDIIRNPKISESARLLYVVMASYANTQRRNGITGRRRLAEDMGKSMDSITRLLRELEAHGVIEREPRYEELAGGGRRRTSDGWVLLDAYATSEAKRGTGRAYGHETVAETNAARQRNDRDPWVEHVEPADYD